MRVILLLFALVFPSLGWSNPPTDTPTPTFTPTPGEGSYSIAPNTFVNGSQGNGFDMTYSSGPSAWPSSGGLLTILFPQGLDAPTPSNFYLSPGYASKLVSYSFSGHTVQIGLKDLGPSEQVVLRYGQNATGFAVNTTQSSQTLLVSSYPQSLTLGAGGQLLAQPTLAIQSPTVTPTLTVTPSSTISNTYTESPTFSMTPTITQTFTETPVGGVLAGQVYSYPNPFDLARFSKVTFRFEPDATARLSVFNVAGEPVRELPLTDIQGSLGFAIWRGEDDLNRLVGGGLYFVRVKGKQTLIRKFTVLH